MVEMAPPDVAGALAANAIDAFSMGEPYPSQAEMVGFGRVLFHAREYWPDYISCVLVVRDDVIENKPEAVQVLVDGIARSGLWLENPPKTPRAPRARRRLRRTLLLPPGPAPAASGRSPSRSTACSTSRSRRCARTSS